MGQTPVYLRIWNIFFCLFSIKQKEEEEEEKNRMTNEAQV
jgi:hypothetical protein